MKRKILFNFLLLFVVCFIFGCKGCSEDYVDGDCEHENLEWVVFEDSTCTKLGTKKQICSDCGKTIPDPDTTLCADCKQRRREKAKEWLITAGKVVGVAAAVVGAVCVAVAASGDDETNSTGYDSLPLDDESGEPIKKCANCGNTDKNTLWDEEDTIYCSKCCHRTSKATGEDDVVECPYCHRMRDRKAMYCRHCNDSTWEASTPKEFAEIDKILKEYGH